MWCGIAAFVLVGLGATESGIYLWSRRTLEMPGFIVLWICISVVTAGLIYTFRDKTPKSK